MTASLTAVLPNKFQIAAFAATIDEGIKEAAKGMEADFQKTVATWNTKPTFTKVIEPTAISISTRYVTIRIKTDDKIYGYVSKGTSKHIITAKPGKALVFAPGGAPKTQPRVIGSGAGAPGSVIHVQREVEHPGIVARAFDETIAVAWKPKFNKLMATTVSRAVKASGHSVAGAFKGLFGR
jgi:hypothetical protein